MTIAYRAGTASAATASATAPAITVPTGLTSTDISLLHIWAKRTTSTTATTSTTPTGWTLLGTATIGATGTANGADVGNVDIFLYYREGTYTAPTLAVANANSAGAIIVAYSRTLSSWQAPIMVSGVDNTSAANGSITGGTWASAVTTGDMIANLAGYPGDVGTMSALTIGGMAGATVAATTARFIGGSGTGGITTGNDSRGTAADAAITAGSSTAAPTFTWTNASSLTGVAGFVRLREFNPPAPTTAPTVTVGTVTASSVALSWTTVTDATSYDVERDTVVVASPTASPYTDSGLAEQTTYTYRVRGKNATGAGPWSASVTATTPAAPPTPIRGVSSGGAISVTTIDVSLPTGTVTNDELILIITSRDIKDGTSWASPAGWTLLERLPESSGEGFFYRAKYGVDITGPGPWTFGSATADSIASDKYAYVCLALKNTSTSGYALGDAQIRADTSTNSPTPSITTTGSSIIVALVGDRATGGSTWTFPAGWTEQVEAVSDVGGTNAMSAAAALYNTVPAPAGTYSVNAVASVSVSQAWAGIYAFTASAGTPAPAYNKTQFLSFF